MTTPKTPVQGELSDTITETVWWPIIAAIAIGVCVGIGIAAAIGERQAQLAAAADARDDA